MSLLARIAAHFLSFFALVSAQSALSADPEATRALNYFIDNETPQSTYNWNLWASYSGVSDASRYAVSQGQEIEENTGNKVRLIDATFINTGYLYFNLPLPQPLIGSFDFSTRVRFEIEEGSVDDLSIELGYEVRYLPYGLGGMTVVPYKLNLKNPDGSSNVGWQQLGGNMSAAIANHRNTVTRNFALSYPTDFLPRSIGPTLFLKNGSCANRNGVYSCNRQLRVKVYLDDTRINGYVVPNDGYDKMASDVARAYSERVSPVLENLYADIENSIDRLNSAGITLPYIKSRLDGDVAELVQSHQTIKTSALARAPFQVPTQADYEKEVRNSSELNILADSVDYMTAYAVEHADSAILPLAWPATGNVLLNETRLGVPAQPADVISATAALGEYEPISFVLKNLFANGVIVNQLGISDLTNEFGDRLPPSSMDVRLVKSWYTGSATTTSSAAIIPQLVPELLLKDDALVKVSHPEKKNFLRINGTTYQDVSSPSAVMPVSALADDAQALQSFSIPSLESRQIWLTLDTHGQIKPGRYQGNVQMQYTLENDSTLRTFSLPIDLMVLPFRLDASNLEYSIYYVGKIHGENQSRMVSQFKTPIQYRAEMVNLLKHGIQSPTQYLNATAEDISDLYLPIRREIGFPCDKVFLLDGIGNIPWTPSSDQAQIDAKAEEAFIKATQIIEATRSVSGCENADVFLHGQDEALVPGMSVQEVLTRQKPSWRRAKEAGARTFVAGFAGAFDILGDDAGLLDTFVFSGFANRTEISKWRNIGQDVFSYNNPQAGVPNPHVYRRNFGLYLWQNDYTGAMDFAYQYEFPRNTRSPSDLSNGVCADSYASGTGYCSAWNDFDSSYAFDLVFTYPTSNGVIDTIQWEGFREGIDDTRYLATLQHLIAQNASPESLSAHSWLALQKSNAEFDPSTLRMGIIDHIRSILTAANQPPAIHLTADPLSSTMLRVKIAAADPEGMLASVEYRIFGHEWQRVDGHEIEFDIPAPTGGNHTIEARAYDAWGSVTSAVIGHFSESNLQLELIGDTGKFVADENDSGLGHIRYYARISNLGPELAKSVGLKSIFPAGFDLRQVSPTQGGCDSSGTECALGDLASGSNLKVVFEFTTRSRSAANFSASVFSESVDPDITNDTVVKRFGGSAGLLFLLMGLLLLLGRYFSQIKLIFRKHTGHRAQTESVRMLLYCAEKYIGLRSA